MADLALFLDRDGVINIDYGYVHNTENFEFIDGIFDLARIAVSYGLRLIVVTNQAGIGRGFYSEEQFNQLTSWMCQKFIEENAPLSHVYYCPFHPTNGVGRYLKDDYSRKPNPGMFFQAQRDFDIDLSNSVLIGDKVSDIEAGIAAGIGTNLLLAYNGLSLPQGLNHQKIDSLYDAINVVKKCGSIGGGI
jgi:D-glycero-D-manno-heptose 1,7-bisphosphate phosphatase